VQCKNGLLMRPDGELYILPIAGGTPRRMRCNTSRMNSWHSFSPNGRWLVFSSKSRSPYTQMCLTHLDEDGHDSPAILIPNATAANRAVNIPEFVDIRPDGLLKIDVPAAEMYRLLDLGKELAEKGDNLAAIKAFRKSLAIDPHYDKAHYELAVVLARRGQLDEAADHYQEVLKTDPKDAASHNNLGNILFDRGRLDEAISHLRAALESEPTNTRYHANLAIFLVRRGQYAEAISEFQKVLSAKPEWAEAHNGLGDVLFKAGRLAEAISEFELALRLKPGFALARSNLEQARAAAAAAKAPREN